MICIYFDYFYGDMPMGGWGENPFDDRLCWGYHRFFWFYAIWYRHVNAIWIYLSNYNREWPYYRMVLVGWNLNDQISILNNWVQKLDSFLLKCSNYLKMDYIACALHAIEEYDINYFLNCFHYAKCLWITKKKTN